MSQFFTVEADVSGALAALDQLGDAVERYALEAARETGRAIRDEAIRRVRRATGETAGAIAMDEQGGAVRVFQGPTSHPANLPLWIEGGTRRGMVAKPYFWASVRLEAGAHERRIREAIQSAINDAGGG